MKKLIFFTLVLTLPFINTSFAQEKNYNARAAAASSSQAMALSMIGWGVGLSLAFVGVFLLVKSSEGSTNH